MTARFSLLALIFASTTAFACPPKNYEYGEAQLTYDGKVIRNFFDHSTFQSTPQTFNLVEGDEMSIDATGGLQDVSFHLRFKLVGLKRAKMGEKASATYDVTETTGVYESTTPGTTSKRYKITVTHIEGTRSMDPDGCSEVIKQEVNPIQTEVRSCEYMQPGDVNCSEHGRHN